MYNVINDTFEHTVGSSSVSKELQPVTLSNGVTASTPIDDEEDPTMESQQITDPDNHTDTNKLLESSASGTYTVQNTCKIKGRALFRKTIDNV